MNSDILQHYTVLVEFLGKALGPDYEVVLHDLSSKDFAIAAIANGHISGRKVGGPLTDAALRMLSSRAYETDDFLSNYRGIAPNGHVLRSSTMFIRDEEDHPMGLLCINFDDWRYKELTEKLLSIIHPESYLDQHPAYTQPLMQKTEETSAPQENTAAPITENFSMDIPALMQKIFDEATASLETPIDRLNQFERREIVERLNEQGLFQLKGAVSFVARKFSCSNATIYRYLSEISA